MSELWCGIDHEHRAIVAFDICGCVAGLSVLDHREADAYSFGAKEAKAGLRVEQMPVETIKAQEWHCPDHPEGAAVVAVELRPILRPSAVLAATDTRRAGPVTRCLVIATLATFAGAIAALFWAFVKVGGDFRERELQASLTDSDSWTEAQWQAAGWEAGW